MLRRRKGAALPELEQTDVESTSQRDAPPPSRRNAAIALALLIPAPTIGALVSIGIAPGVIGQAVYIAAKVWLFAMPAVWWFVVERGRWSWSPARKGGFGVGALLGLAISMVIVGAYWTVGRAVIDVDAVRAAAAGNQLDEPARYLALVAYLTLVNSVLEEYVWRWFAFRQFEMLLGNVRHAGGIAVVLAAAAFTLHHAVALGLQFGWVVTALGSLGVFIGGATWSWVYLRYRSVWPAYLSHAIVDVAVFVVGWWLLFGE